MMIDPSQVTPIPPLEVVAERMTAPVIDGPPDVIPGFLPRQGQLVIAGETNVGKAMALDTPIYTPNGWHTMGSIRVGMKVFGRSGEPTTVVAKSDVMTDSPCFRVTFDDHESVVVDGRHEWSVFSMHLNCKKPLKADRYFKRHAVKTTIDLYEAGVWKQTTARHPRTRWRITLPEALNFPEASAPLPIDPYLLGLWLGDGSSNGGQYTTADPELVKAWADGGWAITKLTGPYLYGIKGLMSQLRDLGVLNNKHIPTSYLHASIEARQALLAGLLDTDGWRCGKGTAEFSNMNATLAEGFYQLAVQLGCKVSRSTKEAKLYGKPCGTCHNIRLHATFNPFRLQRKAKGWEPMTENYRSITDIQPVASEAVQCIRVAASDHLFLAGRNCTPTHNSLVALEVVSAMATGSPLWGTMQPTLKAKRVLYVLGEHYSDVIKRLWQHTRLPMSEDVWIIGPEKLGADKWLVSGGKQNVQAVSKFKKWAEGADLIVFDPLAAFISGIDVENDNVQMRLLLDTMSLISQSTGASSIVLAHQGKPSMGQNGVEYRRKSYAIRGASGIEDAATNIFYMGHADGESKAAHAIPANMKVFQMSCRKYKGETPSDYMLLRDGGTLTHTMLGSRPFNEVMRIDRVSKFKRMQETFPQMGFSDIVRMMATLSDCSESTIRRDLERIS